MSAIIDTAKDVPKALISEVKSQAAPATKDGVLNQAVGFALGIPISMFYDWLYEMVAAKVITNALARNILKVVAPAGVGLIIQFAKLPFGNLLAGTGYAVSLISAGKLLYAWIKEKFFGKKGTAETGAAAANAYDSNEITLWGVQE